MMKYGPVGWGILFIIYIFQKCPGIFLLLPLSTWIATGDQLKRDLI